MSAQKAQLLDSYNANEVTKKVMRARIAHLFQAKLHKLSHQLETRDRELAQLRSQLQTVEKSCNESTSMVKYTGPLLRRQSTMFYC